MDQDLGGSDDFTDDGIASFLAENLGEIDNEFLEEFRSSDLFDEFIQQLNTTPNQSTPPSSRRPSLTDLDAEARTSVNNSDGGAGTHHQQKEELPGPSTSRNSLPQSITCSDQNKKRRAPCKPWIYSKTGEHQRKEIPKSKKNKDLRSGNTVEDEVHPTAQSSKKTKSVTKSGLSSCENEAEKADKRNERKRGRESNWQSRFMETLTFEKPIVRLCDLVMMKKLFPNGVSRVSRVVITPRLLEEIRCLERAIVSAETGKKLIKKNSQTPTNKSTEKQTFKAVKTSSDGRQQSAERNTNKSTNLATKIGQALEKEQLLQSKKQSENKKPADSKLSGREAKKGSDNSRKMSTPSVASNTKNFNHATKTDHYPDKSDSSPNNKAKHHTEAEADKREHTNKHLKSSVEEIVSLEKNNEPKYIDKKATSKVSLSTDGEKRNRGQVVNLYVPLFGIPKKKDTPDKDKSLKSHVLEKPERSSALECVGSKNVCEKTAEPVPVNVEPDKSPSLECRLIENVDEKLVTPEAVKLEVPPPLKLQAITEIDEKKESPQDVQVDVGSSLLECQRSKNVVEEQESPPVHIKPEIFLKSEDEVDTLQAVKADSEVASPMECQESMDTGDNVTMPSNTLVESESPALECPEESIAVNEAEAVQPNDLILDTLTDAQNLSPDDASDVQNSCSPEETTRRKPGSPERSSYKRKNVIESSSDDENRRIDAAEDTDPREGKSDEEQLRKTLLFERKRDQEDSRSKKFDKFEHERMRKLGEKKKGKAKPKETMALEEILKEKPLSGSFRIPKKTTGSSRRLPKSALTPLASAAAPKEKMQFERCRKTTEKDRWDKDNNRGRDFREYNRCEDNEFSGTNYPNRRKGPGQHFRELEWSRDKDDGRVVLLAPSSIKQDTGPSPSPPRSPLNAEPEWGNDGGADQGGASSSSSSSDDANCHPSVEDSTKQKPATPNFEVNEDSNGEELQPTIDPEVPIEFPQGNIITSGVLYFLSVGEKIDLPNVKSMESKDATVMKLAWWFSNIDIENAVAVDASDSECDDNRDEEGANNRNFLKKLDFTESDDEDLFPSGSSDPRRKPYMGLVGEACGRALLRAQYRSGPGDKFENIFNLRGGASYEKENFQASCTLCKSLVVGKVQLADHVSSDEHKLKMSKAGLGDVNGDKVSSDNKNRNDKVGRDKMSESEDKRSTNSKQKEVVKISRSRTTDESRDKKKVEDSKKKEDAVDKHDSSEKRKRSKDDASNDESRKSKVDTDKPDTKAVERRPSRGNRSRSRSPRHKRTRSRSPRRRSRSPRGHRRRSRSIQRVPRSPSKLREQKRRSTSAERVEKFLAKTNQVPRRRSRSPSKGYSRKRHRRSRSKSPIGLVLPRRDNREFNEKLILVAEGIWTNEMEQQWKFMEAELAIFIEQYGEKKCRLNDSPESHPVYASEWTAFWEKRYSEVQDEGLDADTYEYIPEWKEYWSKRLRDLLELEYEKGVKEIKQKYSMDLDSLHKIRLAKDTSKTVTLKAEPPPPSAMSTPQDLATPSTPSSIAPAPSHHESVPLVITKSICSNASANGEDYTARSMSISDCGDGDNRSDRDPNVTSAKGVTSNPAPTAVDIMSHWEKLRSGELVQQPQPSNSSMPRSKNTDNMSNADSGSIASCDFDGFDLTQVLRLMSNLEDQLSFLAEKVKEYFKKAEELDLKKKNKSYQLLEDEEFVVMLFTVRDRFMAMIRANVLSKDVLKSLNYTVYALNSILKAPQCQKHRTKTATTAGGFEKGKNEPDLPKTAASTKLTEASSSLPAGSPLINILSSTKGKIAVLITEFLQNMGCEYLSDAELRELVKKLLPSTVKGESKGIASKSQQSSKQPERNTEEANVSLGFWHPNEVRNATTTRTGVILATGATGSSLQFPTLPNVTVPVLAPVHDDGGYLESREDVWSHTLSRQPDNVSSSDSRSRSPFSRRDFTGNPTAKAFRDKGTLNAHRLAQTELDNHYFAIDDPLPDSFCQGEGMKRSEPEVLLDQVTQRSCRNDVQSSGEESPRPVNNPMIRLVKGISNIIDKERTLKNQDEKKVRNTARSSDVRRGRDRDRHKQRKKRKLERERRYRSSSNSSRSSIPERRHHRLQRKRKRREKRKDENTEWTRPSVAASDISIESIHSSIKSVQWKGSKSNDSYSASLRESNSRTRRRSGQHFSETRMVDNPTETAESHQRRSRQSIRINIPSTFQPNNCNSDALSEISSIGDAKKQVRAESTGASLCEKTDDNASAAGRKEITSVSKAFWTADAEEISAYSSVSSNELKEPEKGSRQYKTQPTRKHIEKEPGEITDSSCS